MEETEGQSGNGLHAWEWRFNSPVVLCTKIHAPLDPFPSETKALRSLPQQQ